MTFVLVIPVKFHILVYLKTSFLNLQIRKAPGSLIQEKTPEIVITLG